MQFTGWGVLFICYNWRKEATYPYPLTYFVILAALSPRILPSSELAVRISDLKAPSHVKTFYRCRRKPSLLAGPESCSAALAHRVMSPVFQGTVVESSLCLLNRLVWSVMSLVFQPSRIFS